MKDAPLEPGAGTSATRHSTASFLSQALPGPAEAIVNFGHGGGAGEELEAGALGEAQLGQVRVSDEEQRLQVHLRLPPPIDHAISL